MLPGNTHADSGPPQLRNAPSKRGVSSNPAALCPLEPSRVRMPGRSLRWLALTWQPWWPCAL